MAIRQRYRTQAQALTRRPLLCALVLTALAAQLAFAQGPLTPPGPPTPLMKTLEQVEARTPIDAIHTPGDASATFRITARGSYYLTGDLIGEPGKAGIFITAPDVAIDLNGFAMIGPGGASPPGAIEVPFPPAPRPENTTLRNGTIKGWGFAVTLGASSRVEHITLTGNAFDALSCGGGSLIMDSIATNNGQNGIGGGDAVVIRSCVARGNGSTGILGGRGAVVSHCSANSNGQVGILVGPNSTVQSCSASNNSSTGIAANERAVVVDSTAAENGAIGIVAFDSAVVQRCTASSNRGEFGISVEQRSQVLECVADFNGTGTLGTGIRGNERTVVKHCSATGNRLYGIDVRGESLVVDNRASQNGQGAPAAGIRTRFDGSASGSRIEGNHTRDNTGVGILAHPTADVIIRNTAGNNTGGNFNPSSGTNFAPIQTPATATNPFANIQF